VEIHHLRPSEGFKINMDQLKGVYKKMTLENSKISKNQGNSMYNTINGANTTKTENTL